MKKIIMLAISLLLASIVIGCSSDNAENGGGDNELIWNTTAGYSPQATEPEVAEYLSRSVEDFESDYPDIELNTTIMSTNISEAMAKLTEQANQGRAPDISAIDSYLFPQYIDYLQPLDDLIEEKELDPDDFLEFAQDTITGPDGKIYGLYMSTDTRVLFYNKGAIPNPPETWDDVIELAKELKEDGYEGISIPGGRGEGASVTTLWPLFWGLGGELVDDGKAIFGEGENREKMITVLETIQKAVEEGVVPQRVASYGSENDQNEDVASGKIPMFIGGSWQETMLKDILDEEEFEQWDVAPLPIIEGGEETTSSGGWAWGIFTDDPDKKQAAFDFIYDTYISEEGMGEFTSVQGSLPARFSVYDSDHYERTAFSDDYRDMLDSSARVRPASNEYAEISNEMQIALSDVISGNKEPEQAVDDAWKVVNNE